MRNYFETNGPDAPMLNQYGGMNLERLFAMHGNLRDSNNAEACLAELLGHVRERWLSGTYNLVGILWTTHNPILGKSTGMDVLPVPLDLASSELSDVAREVAMVTPDVIVNHPALREVHEAELRAFREQMGEGMDVAVMKRKLAHDAMLAFMGQDMMRQGAEATKAIGATVIGRSGLIATSGGGVVPGLIAFHEHIRSGSRRLWAPGVIQGHMDAWQDAPFASLGDWETNDAADDHPIMRRYRNMLCVDAYGPKGGDA